MSTTTSVGFVAITNHVLDAAKSNRCVVLLRPEPDGKELATIARGLLFDRIPNGATITREVVVGETTVAADSFAQELCGSYSSLVLGKLKIEEAGTFFGLRDFMYFLKSLKSRSKAVTVTKLHISIACFVRAVERNFNGLERRSLYQIIAIFLKPFCELKELSVNVEKFASPPLDVIQESLENNSACVDQEKRARFTLLIDCSEDDSIMRVLRLRGLLDFTKKSLFKLSHMPEEATLEKTRLISGVKFTAGQGKVALLSQTEAVNESFYDLFNQHFREVKNRDGEQNLYTNLAIGGVSRRVPVDPAFECIVHVRSSQVREMPAPFLNRFEKFRLDLSDVFDAALSRLGGVKPILLAAKSQTKLLLQPLLEENGLFGWAKNDRTLDSVIIGMLPIWALTLHGAAPCEFCVDKADSFAGVLIEFVSAITSRGMNVDDLHLLLLVSKQTLPQDQEEMLDRLTESSDSACFEDLRLALQGLLVGQPGSGVIDKLCQSVLQMALTRLAVFELIQLATPEAMFAKRHALPSEIFDHYLASANGSLDELMQTGLRDLDRNSEARMIVAYSRTDAFNLAISSTAASQDLALVDKETTDRIASLALGTCEAVMLERLELLRSEAKLRSSLQTWIQQDKTRVYVLLVDMKARNAKEQCNCTRMCVEQRLSTAKNKLFILLLHYSPASICKSSCYPALSLGRWSHCFIDSVGQRGPQLGASHFIRLSCELEDVGSGVIIARLLGLLEELLPVILSHIACRQVLHPRQLAPLAAGAKSPFCSQISALKALFSQMVGTQTIKDVLFKKFTSEWMKQALPHATKQASRALLEGTTQLSMGTAIQSTLEKAFATFVMMRLSDMSADQNIDVLETQESEEVRQLFGYILKTLPAVPFREILLRQDIASQFRPKQEMTAAPKFPFFALISSYINESLELAEKQILKENKDAVKRPQRFCTGKRLYETSMELLRKMANSVGQDDGETSHRAVVLLEVILLVSKSSVLPKSDSLFTLYMQQFVQHATGCEPNSVMVQWLEGALQEVTDLRDILGIHCVQRYRQVEFIRTVSWSSSVEKQFLVDENEAAIGNDLQGVSLSSTVFLRMLDYLETTLSTCIGADSDWVTLLASFLAQVGTGLAEESMLRRHDIQARIRVLESTHVLLGVDNAREALPNLLAKWYDEGLRRIVSDGGNEVSMVSILSMVDSSKDTKVSLLWHFLSPRCRKIWPDYYQDDLRCLMIVASSELSQTQDHRLAMALIHRACSMDDDGFILGFSNQAVDIISESVFCQRQRESSMEGGQKCGPHCVPRWLQAAPNLSREHEPDSRNVEALLYPGFFSTYIHSFDDDFLSSLIFDLVLCILLRKTCTMSSSEVLVLLLRDVEAEIGLAADEDRLNSAVFSPLAAMVADARVICFVAKVAQELAQQPEAAALSGHGSELGMTLLNQIMAIQSVRFRELLFALIVHHGGGESSLAALLRYGGQLHGVSWCRSLQNGIPSSRGSFEAALSTAQSTLREAEAEEQRKSREVRICPHCGEHFMVDARNCGSFVCGRDAHGVDNGMPAVGGRAVAQTYGCGRAFPLDEAGHYRVDDTHLRRLRADVAGKAADFRSFEASESNWNEMLAFEVPTLLFSIRQDQVGVAPVPAAFIAPENNLLDHQSRLLQCLLDGRRFVDQQVLSILPDLIEVRLWLFLAFAPIFALLLTYVTMSVLSLGTQYFQVFDHAGRSHVQRNW
jgi:hypothetical protein